MIALLNDKKLARQFHAGNVPEKDNLCYLIVFSVLCALTATSFMSGARLSPNIYDLAMDALMISMAIAAPILSYVINRKGDGRDFAVRYIGLSVPISIQTLIVSLITGLAAGYYAGSHQTISQEAIESFIPASRPEMLASMLIAYAYMIWRYIVTFRVVSGLKA